MFGNVPGSQPADFNISLVKLASGPQGCRLVGAAEFPQRDPSDASKNWDLYSKFIEDQMPITTEGKAPGQILFSVPEGLATGDYGIVLRPAVKTKTFSSAEIVSSALSGLISNCKSLPRLTKHQRRGNLHLELHLSFAARDSSATGDKGPPIAMQSLFRGMRGLRVLASVWTPCSCDERQ
jgi:hypothetical protein